MKLSIPQINNNTRQIVKAVSDFVTTVSKNKKVQITLASIPVFGWIGSEIQRNAENRNHQKQVALYQEVLRKHQAEIDVLKNDKEREAYKQKLWEQFIKSSAEGRNGQI